MAMAKNPMNEIIKNPEYLEVIDAISKAPKKHNAKRRTKCVSYVNRSHSCTYIAMLLYVPIVCIVVKKYSLVNSV